MGINDGNDKIVQHLGTIIAYLGGIYTAWFNANKGYLSFRLLLTIFTAFLIFYFAYHFVFPQWNKTIYPVVKKLIKYTAILSFLFFLSFLVFNYAPPVSRWFKDKKDENVPVVKKDSSSTVKENDKAASKNGVEKSRIENRKTEKKANETKPEPRRIKNWHELINRDKLCNSEPVKIWNIRGVSDLQARTFLSNIPKLKHSTMVFAGQTKTSKYNYHYYYKVRTPETWNEEKQNYYIKLKELGGDPLARGKTSAQVYKEQMKLLLEKTERWRDQRIFDELNAIDIRYFKKGLDSELPRIVLYHEFTDTDLPKTKSNMKYKKRASFRRFEFHIFYFVGDNPFGSKL